MNFLLNFLSPSVDSLTASLRKTVTRLNEVADKAYARSEKLRDEALQLKLKANDADREGDRALQVAQRLQDHLTA